jgi:hypothetical protein
MECENDEFMPILKFQKEDTKMNWRKETLNKEDNILVSRCISF